MRFDWYSGTFSEDETVLVDTLAGNLGAEATVGKALHGYDRGYALKNDKGTVARVLAGGRNGRPNAWASGQNTDAFVEVARGLWPNAHYVTRFDAAEDWVGEDAFERLDAMVVGIADARRLKVNQAGDWHRKEDGRTRYIGSMKSPVFLRLYEKGLQERSAAPDDEQREKIPADWARLELVVRPGREARHQAAQAAPEDAWGYSSWAQEVAQMAMQLDVPRVPITVWRQTDDDRAMSFLIKQYGDTMGRKAEQLGGFAALGEFIGQQLAARDARRDK